MSRKHTQSKHTQSKHTAGHASHQRQKIHKRNLTWLWIGLAVLLVIFVGILLIRPRTTPSSDTTPAPPDTAAVEITPAQAYEKIQQGAFVLDVRSLEEWDQFHIAGSTQIPLDQLQNRLGELPKDKDIVVVCLSGHRSQNGTSILQQAGFTRVFCLSGGLQAWTDAKYPVEGNVP
jgi:rhodanese-related sulfurtransferase